MKSKQKKTQLILLFTGSVLLFLTYFYNPLMQNNQTFNNKLKQETLENNKDYNKEYDIIKFEFSKEDLFENELENIKDYLFKTTRFNMKEIETKINIIYN